MATRSAEPPVLPDRAGSGGLHNFVFAFQDALLGASPRDRAVHRAGDGDRVRPRPLAVAVQRTVTNALGGRSCTRCSSCPWWTEGRGPVIFRLMYIPSMPILKRARDLGICGCLRPAWRCLVVSVDVWRDALRVPGAVRGARGGPARRRRGGRGGRRRRRVGRAFLDRPAEHLLLLLVLVFRFTGHAPNFHHVQVLSMGGAGRGATSFSACTSTRSRSSSAT